MVKRQQNEEVTQCTREMSVRCVPCKHDNSCEDSSMVIGTCDPSTGGAVAEGSWELDGHQRWPHW